MGRKIQVCALSLLGAFGYTSAAFAQPAPAPAPAPAAAPAAAPAEAPAAAAPATTEPAPAAAAPAPAAEPAPAAPAPAVVEPLPAAPPPNVFDGLKIESKNGSATLKLGLLLQPQYEATSSGSNLGPVSGIGDEAHEGLSNNLFIRRTRLLVGGTLFNGAFEYFFDTDAPNLFKGDTTLNANAMAPANPNGSGAKGGNAMIVQDAFGTAKLHEAFKIDVGYMLTPGAHNALQGAGTLYGLDYFSNTFIHNTLLNTNVNPSGRDTGLQFRGLLLDNHIEYRLGVFQGKRNAGTADQVAGQNMFRLAGRVQVRACVVAWTSRS